MVMSERERLIGRDLEPSEKQILEFIGSKAIKLWNELHEFLSDNYDFQPELSYWGDNYGWTIRYRRSGKTLTAFYPENGGFTVQVILGKKEVEKFQKIKEELSTDIVGRIRQSLSNLPRSLRNMRESIPHIYGDLGRRKPLKSVKKHRFLWRSRIMGEQEWRRRGDEVSM